jgi:sepiapterin reductase
VKIGQLKDIPETIHLNLISPIHQVNYLLSKKPTVPLTLVNMSSLAALQPFDCWSLYCCGKAARDQFFRSVALEFPHVRVLNYAPGPCDTRLKTQILTEMPDGNELKAQMQALDWIPVEKTVDVLLNLLLKNEFENGTHLDYYDCC